jgi:NAD(P)-dependent dehydrogenase (short-subunit alcohol dehydrogenase family)
MELRAGQVAVVTGGASGIGLALGERFASAGLDVVLADVQEDALTSAAAQLERHGVGVLPVRVDVSREAEVAALVDATIERFDGVHVVCNNAGVAQRADPWFGPLESWEWVMGVNFWGVVHGCRAFLPHLMEGGHIVNTASIAGLIPALEPVYDASKHAVVALTEGLLHAVNVAALPIGVSVLCPGWVRTNIIDADRNWPDRLGDRPERDAVRAVTEPHVRRAVAEGATPALIADAVVDAIGAGRFWVIPQPEFLDLAVERWSRIAELLDPEPAEHLPGMPPRSQILNEVMAALGMG